jgi:hypothetical protein
VLHALIELTRYYRRIAAQYILARLSKSKWLRLSIYIYAVIVPIAALFLFFFYLTTSSSLTVISSDEINKAPNFVQHALLPAVMAYRESWSRAKPLLDRDGRPFPGKHEYIAPAIAWAQIETRDGFVGLSLVDSNCDGPNSITSDDYLYARQPLRSTMGVKPWTKMCQFAIWREINRRTMN